MRLPCAFTANATDDSGYSIAITDYNVASITSASGKKVSAPLSQSGSGYFTDTNGNEITADGKGNFTDTLEPVINFVPLFALG